MFDRSEGIEEVVFDPILIRGPIVFWFAAFCLFVWQGSGPDRKHAGGFFRFL